LKADIPEKVKSEVPDFDKLAEQEIKDLIRAAAKLSLTDRVYVPSRCWTTGESSCGCWIPNDKVPLSWDIDGSCDMKCPKGESCVDRGKTPTSYCVDFPSSHTFCTCHARDVFLGHIEW
jgi:hypothetical protein